MKKIIKTENAPAAIGLILRLLWLMVCCICQVR